MAPPLAEQNYPIAPSLVPAAAGGAPPPGDGPGRSFWLTPWALIAAALLHLLPAMLWLLAHLEARPSYEVPAIQVTLVREPPRPPPPAAKTEPPKITPRESGADEKTEAKKTAKAEPALPQSGSPRESQARPVPPEPRAEAPAEKFLAIRLPQKGGNADRDLAGDPYLNRMMQKIERNRIYPPAADFIGSSSRLTIFSVVLEPSGAMNAITLLNTSGTPRLDEAARLMITSSAPFPPLPPDYPQIRTRIVIEIPIYPRGS